MPANRQARALGFDLSTTGLAVVVRGEGDELGFASRDAVGATRWHGQPAFDLWALPWLIARTLDDLEAAGWTFPHGEGVLSFSVRQHDLAITRDDGRPLMPALSWQCNAATEQVARLREAGVEDVVGRVEERFVLPKLAWVLEDADPALRDEIRHVMTTGDFVAWMLTGAESARLSTSDALSNGLLVQQSKDFAADVVVDAGLAPDWFPEKIPSGTPVGRIDPADFGRDWNELRERLAGWTVVAGLGDNHASAVGCGLADDRSIVVSAGSSGTVNRRCNAAAQLAGNAVRFDYYDHRLLLMMLPDCAVWYNRFRETYGPHVDHDELNQAAADAKAHQLVRVQQRQRPDGTWEEVYPAGWSDLPFGVQVASTQFSIALELLRLVQAMLLEVRSASEPVGHFALTGGLSRSPFFQTVFASGVQVLAGTNARVDVSAREGHLGTQTAACGALVNAELPGRFHGDLEAAVSKLCPLRACEPADETLAQALRPHLQ